MVTGLVKASNPGLGFVPGARATAHVHFSLGRRVLLAGVARALGASSAGSTANVRLPSCCLGPPRPRPLARPLARGWARRLCAHGALSKDELCTLARGEACADGAEQRAADPWRGPGTPNERRGACVFARAGAELGQQSSQAHLFSGLAHSRHAPMHSARGTAT